MNRIPLLYWAAALGAGIVGFVVLRKKSTASSTSPATKASSTPQFSQAQEVQDFQVFSSLTSAQQASDLNFLTEIAGLVGGGSSTGTTNVPTSGAGGGGSAGTSTVPSPAPTGTVSPATVPASGASSPAPAPQSEPGYGANIGALLAANPALTQPGANIPGITGYTAGYNGVPI